MEERRLNVSTPGIAALVFCAGLAAVADAYHLRGVAVTLLVAGVYLLVALKVVRQSRR